MALKNVAYPSIDAKRRELGVPKQAVADKLDLSWESVNKKLSGKVEFSVTEILTLSDWWGTSMDELVGRTVPCRPVLTLARG